jgi:hypothetical protein
MSHRSRLVLLLVVVASSSIAPAVLAQSAGISAARPVASASAVYAASSAPSSSSAPPLVPAAPAPLDIVRLKDGSFVRGTILEHDPRTRTVIETRTGVRTIEASDVAYAGLASREVVEPAPPPASSSSAAPPVPVVAVDKQVHFRAWQRNLQVYAEPLSGASKEARGLRPICVAPCEATIERGAYRLAFGEGAAAPLVVRNAVELQEGATVEARVLSRRLTRTVGYGVMGASAVPIVYGLVRTLVGKTSESRSRGFVVAIVGAGVGAAGFVISRADDIAEADVLEQTKPSKTSLGPVAPSGAPLGTSLGGRF